jgi:hypothetical protein
MDDKLRMVREELSINLKEEEEKFRLACIWYSKSEKNIKKITYVKNQKERRNDIKKDRIHCDFT